MNISTTDATDNHFAQRGLDAGDESQPRVSRLVPWVDIIPPLLICTTLVVTCILKSSYLKFWIDEIFTFVVATDPSFPHMLGAEADMINAAPPFYFIAVWSWAKVFGVSEVALRLFSCLGYCVGGVLMWRLLKRTFGRWPAAVGTMVVLLTARGVNTHMCEARFYGLLFVETVLATCLFAALCTRKKAGYGLLLGNAIVHGALVTTHYLAFLYSAVFLFAFCLIWARDFRALALRCGSILVGWLCFLPCIPGFLHHQEFGKPRGWIPPPQLSELISSYNTAGEWFAPIVVVMATLYMLVSILSNEDEMIAPSPHASEPERNSTRPLTPLLIVALCFFLIPIVLWGYSKALTPMFLQRYLLAPLLISWGILLAWFVQRLCLFQKRKRDSHSKWARIACAAVPQIGFVALIALSVVIGGEDIRYVFVKNNDPFERMYTDELRAIQKLPNDVPILFIDTHAYCLFEHYSERRQQFRLLVDRDWAYTDSPDIPRGAVNNYQFAIALKRQYAAQVLDAADFWREHDRAIYVLNERNRSLFEKWTPDKTFSSETLFEFPHTSVVLVQRKIPNPMPNSVSSR